MSSRCKMWIALRIIKLRSIIPGSIKTRIMHLQFAIQATRGTMKHFILGCSPHQLIVTTGDKGNYIKASISSTYTTISSGALTRILPSLPAYPWCSHVICWSTLHNTGANSVRSHHMLHAGQERGLLLCIFRKRSAPQNVHFYLFVLLVKSLACNQKHLPQQRPCEEEFSELLRHDLSNFRTVGGGINTHTANQKKNDSTSNNNNCIMTSAISPVILAIVMVILHLTATIVITIKLILKGTAKSWQKRVTMKLGGGSQGRSSVSLSSQNSGSFWGIHADA